MIRISADFTAFSKSLDNITNRQVPYAVSRALSDVAKAARDQLTQDLPTIFDRPTPFTRQAIGWTPANRNTLTAWVFVRDLQARYLQLQETGGVRTPASGRGLVIPGRALPLNQFGNIPSGTLKRFRAQAERGRRRKGRVLVYLPQSPRGSGGYFAAFASGGLARLTGFTGTERFSPRFGFRRRVNTVVQAQMLNRMRMRIEEAMQTARYG